MIRLTSDSLIKAVKAIDLVPTRSGIVPSEFIQLEKKKDRLYLSLAAEVFGRTYAKAEKVDGEDWTFHVDRTALVPWVLAAENFGSNRDFEFEVTSKKGSNVLLLKSGRRKVIFNSITFIQGYPEYKAADATTVTLDQRQKLLLTLASRYASPDPTLPYLNCVYMVKGKSILSSNRISLFHGKNKDIPITVPLPLHLLGLIGQDNIKTIEIAKKVVKLTLDCGYLCQSINATAKTDFPVEQSMKQFKKGEDYPVQFKVKAKPFIEAMARLKAYVSGSTQREIYVYAKSIKGEDKLKLYSSTPQGVFTEFVTMLLPAKIDCLCEWKLEYLAVLEEHGETLRMLEVRFDPKTKSPYHINSPIENISLMLSRRV